jgi:phosphatidylglycerophosphate synthase
VSARPGPPRSAPDRRAARLPLALTALRAALGPVVLLLAYAGPHPAGLGACLVAALLSDIFDGVIARRLGVATEALRRLDSLADSIFYVAALVAVWHLHAGALQSRAWVLALLIALELLRYLVDFAKFGREASYHMWSSKLWGLALFAGFFSLLALDADSVAVDLAIWVGILCDLEGLAISLVLRQTRSDVPTIVHAIRTR